MHPEVSVVIPGASRAEQVVSNIRAAELPPLTDGQMQAVREIYDRYLRESIHPQWENRCPSLPGKTRQNPSTSFTRMT